MAQAPFAPLARHWKRGNGAGRTQQTPAFRSPFAPLDSPESQGRVCAIGFLMARHRSHSRLDFGPRPLGGIDDEPLAGFAFLRAVVVFGNKDAVVEPLVDDGPALPFGFVGDEALNNGQNGAVRRGGGVAVAFASRLAVVVAYSGVYMVQDGV